MPSKKGFLKKERGNTFCNYSAMHQFASWIMVVSTNRSKGSSDCFEPYTYFVADDAAGFISLIPWRNKQHPLSMWAISSTKKCSRTNGMRANKLVDFWKENPSLKIRLASPTEGCPLKVTFRMLLVKMGRTGKDGTNPNAFMAGHDCFF